MTKIVTPLLIVGAGPAGLTLAAHLVQKQTSFIICDAARRPVQATKAAGIHPNTLRLFENLGLTSEVLADAHILYGMNSYADELLVNNVHFERGHSPLNRNYAVPQSTVEDALLNYLNQHGVRVRRSVKVTSCQTADEHVTIKVCNGKKRATIVAQFVVGADGTHSSVRNSCRIAFLGTAEARLSFAVDAELNAAKLDFRRVHQFYAKTDRLVCVPLSTEGQWRISGYVPHTLRSNAKRAAVVRGLTQHIAEWLNCRVAINSKSLTTYRLTSKIATTFLRGRCMLIGDAAHTFLPYGGHGLNAAIDDAASLATLWKDNEGQSRPSSADLRKWAGTRRSIARELRREIAIRKSKLSYSNLKNDLRKRGANSISEDEFRRPD